MLAVRVDPSIELCMYNNTTYELSCNHTIIILRRSLILSFSTIIINLCLLGVTLPSYMMPTTPTHQTNTLATIRDITLVISGVVVSLSSILLLSYQYNKQNSYNIRPIKSSNKQLNRNDVIHSCSNETELEDDTLLTMHRPLPFGGELGMSIPIITSSTFNLRSTAHTKQLANHTNLYDPNPGGYFYTRWGNPTAHACSDVIASIENGVSSTLYSSGMSAISAVFLTLMNNESHMIVPNSIYGGTHEFIKQYASKYGFQHSTVDTTEISNIINSIQPNTKLIYLETPSNPTMRLTDIPQIRYKLIELNRTDIIIAVDGTFASPYHTKLLDIGADISIHSCTKYLGGHSDLTAGVVTCRNIELLNKLTHCRTIVGGTIDAFTAFLLHRGLKTLSVRMKQHNYNAMKIAQYLQSHPLIKSVYYPGLTSHPDHQLAQKLYSNGYGGMLSFELKGDDNDSTVAVRAGSVLVDSLNIITLAVSLGSTESLIVAPASTTHSMLTREQRIAAGIDDGLVRFSVGIEHVDDLISDLDQALQHVDIQVYSKLCKT